MKIHFFVFIFLALIPLISSACATYEIEVNGACQRCNITLKGCDTCSNTSFCTRCQSTLRYFPLNPQDGICRCQNTSLTVEDMYLGIYCRTCREFVAGCSQCLNIAQCNVCHDGYLLDSRKLCICAQANFQTSVAYDTYDQCQPCSSIISGCFTCNRSTNCVTCDANYIRVNSITCNCPAPFIVKNGKCVKNCPTGCTDCDGNFCTACDETNHFVHNETAGECSCGNGYYLNETECLSCEDEVVGCAACHKEDGQAKCTLCDRSLNYVEEAAEDGQCDCKVGYYKDTDRSCYQCSNGCLECESDSLCTACDLSGNFVPNGAGGCSCAVGYYSENDLCNSCSTSLQECQICTNGETCTSCNEGFGVTLSGYCSSCTQMLGCLQCQSSNICITCNIDNNFTNDPLTQQCSCSQGYRLNTQNSCQIICPIGCIQCSSNTVCTLCDQDNNFELDSEEFCVCQSKFYLENNECHQCSDSIQNCEICPNSSTCTECATGFGVDQSGLCSACNLLRGCLQCSSSNVCTRCNQDYHFILNTTNGQCYCPPTYYFNSTNSQCELCSQTLSNCSQCVTSFHCTKCISNSFALYSITLLNRVCQLCNVTLSGCLQCSSTSSCALCDSSKNMQLGSDNKCQCISLHYLNSSNQCAPCSSWSHYCQTCTSSGCSTCSPNYVINGTSCKLSCNITGCATCQNSTACSACSANFYLSNKKCYCNEGYTLVNQTCQSCNSTLPGCSKCSNPSDCSDCVDTYYLDIFSSCCRKCGFGCKTCNSLLCLSCINSAYINTILFDCFCASSAYKNATTNTCELCANTILNCNQCSNSTYCTSCNNGLSAINGTCQCYSGQYYSLTLKSCRKCPSNCQECSAATTCTKCDASKNRVLKNGYCACKPGTNSILGILGYNDNSYCF